MYYLITVQNGDTPSMLGYETHDAALAAFHNELGYRHESRTSTKCMIINDNLEMFERDNYIAEPVQTEESQEG